MTQIQHHRTWADLLLDLIREMSSANAELEFDQFEIHIPVSTSEDSPRAPWKLHGTLRIRSRKDA
jgi:hypothetical protein